MLLQCVAYSLQNEKKLSAAVALNKIKNILYNIKKSWPIL